MFPRQLLKAIIVMHVNELKSFKKIEIDDQKKNLNEKKKSFVWMFRIDLKKNKTNNCDKKQKTVYSSERFRKSLRSFDEKKKERKRNNDQWQSRCHILLRSTKMKENYKKKSKSKAFFMFFQQHYKRTNFSVFDDHIYARSPSQTHLNL